MQGVFGLSSLEVKEMLKDAFWRKVWDDWLVRASEQSKLALLYELMLHHPNSRAIFIEKKHQRK